MHFTQQCEQTKASMGGGFFFIGEFLHFLKLKNMILIHTKDFFFQNNGNNSLDFKKQ
jgi:hypothetical protein